MFLVDSSKYAADPEGTIEYLLNVVTKADGEVAVHRPWQDGKLAYGIRFNDSIHTRGLHYLICFTSESSDTIDQVTYTCRVAQEGIVIRHLTIAHPQTLFEPLVASLGAGEGFAAGGDEDDSDGPKGPKGPKDSDGDDDAAADEGDEDATADAEEEVTSEA